MKRLLVTVAIGVAAVVLPAFAHHSFAAEYDMKKPLKITGTVTKVEWLNPHARLFVDVKDPSGKVTNWELELQAPNSLIRSGWTRTSIKPGEIVTVDGYRAKDGSNLGNATAITFSDGRKLEGRNPDAPPDAQ